MRRVPAGGWSWARVPSSSAAASAGDDASRDACLGFLYDREYGGGRNVRGHERRSSGGLGESHLTVPDWINQVHELFPKRTIERLEKDALERYQLDEMVTNPEVLSPAPAEPDAAQGGAAHQAPDEPGGAGKAAQHLVRKVVEELMKKLARRGADAVPRVARPPAPSFLKIAKNFDVETTHPPQPASTTTRGQRGCSSRRRYFFSRVRRHVDRWQIIILVDESGSMVDSVIHSAVTAAIFFGMQDAADPPVPVRHARSST